jgi:hypothetical protein
VTSKRAAVSPVALLTTEDVPYKTYKLDNLPLVRRYVRLACLSTYISIDLQYSLIDRQKGKTVATRLNILKSKFQFLPPIFNFLTLITPFSKFSSKLPHLAKKSPIFTPSELFDGWVPGVRYTCHATYAALFDGFFLGFFFTGLTGYRSQVLIYTFVT